MFDTNETDLTAEEQAILKGIATSFAKGPGLTEHGSVIYRGDHGSRCVVGWMVADREIPDEVQSHSATQFLRAVAPELDWAPLHHTIGHVQDAHDNAARKARIGDGPAYDMAVFRRRLRENLETNFILMPPRLAAAIAAELATLAA